MKSRVNNLLVFDAFYAAPFGTNLDLGYGVWESFWQDFSKL